jgi:hypothetical protein
MKKFTFAKVGFLVTMAKSMSLLEWGKKVMKPTQIW